MNGEIRNIWMRAGVTLHLNRGEAAFLLSERLRHEDGKLSQKDIITSALREGRFTFGGNTYVPSESIQQFNEEYGEDRNPEETVDIDLDPDEFPAPGWKEITSSVLVVTYTDGDVKLMELEPGRTVQEMVSYLNGVEMGAGKHRVVEQVQRVRPWLKGQTAIYAESLYYKN